MCKNLTYLLVLTLTFLWYAGIYAAPFLAHTAAGANLYSLYHNVCHQIPEHSFHAGLLPLAVCMRCTALYTGFLFGVIILPFVGERLKSIISYRYYIPLLAIPMILDFTAAWLTGDTPGAASRLVSGGLFGLGSSLLLVPMFVDAIRQMKKTESSYPYLNKKEETYDI